MKVAWTDGWTDGQTDGRTDGRIDGPMDRPSCRDAYAASKNVKSIYTWQKTIIVPKRVYASAQDLNFTNPYGDANCMKIILEMIHHMVYSNHPCWGGGKSASS